jgi:hypothetical protein
MGRWQKGKSSGTAKGFRFIHLALLTLVLLAGVAYAQSEQQVHFQNLLDKPAHLQKTGPFPEQPAAPRYLPPELHRALLGKLAASRWWQANLQDPLPPASVFATQTDFCKYLDEWPTPGFTASPDEPPAMDLTDADLM